MKVEGHADLVRDTNSVQSLIVIVMHMRLQNEELQKHKNKEMKLEVQTER